MELRWYQTYDRHGVNSDWALQYREDDEDDWEDVEYYREREPYQEEE